MRYRVVQTGWSQTGLSVSRLWGEVQGGTDGLVTDRTECVQAVRWGTGWYRRVGHRQDWVCPGCEVRYRVVQTGWSQTGRSVFRLWGEVQGGTDGLVTDRTECAQVVRWGTGWYRRVGHRLDGVCSGCEVRYRVVQTGWSQTGRSVPRLWGEVQGGTDGLVTDRTECVQVVRWGTVWYRRVGHRQDGVCPGCEVRYSVVQTGWSQTGRSVSRLWGTGWYRRVGHRQDGVCSGCEVRYRVVQTGWSQTGRSVSRLWGEVQGGTDGLVSDRTECVQVVRWGTGWYRGQTWLSVSRLWGEVQGGTDGFLHPCIYMHRCIFTYLHTYIHIHMHIHACVRAYRQTDRQAGRQTDRQADRRTDRQTGRQANRQTCIVSQLLVI